MASRLPEIVLAADTEKERRTRAGLCNALYEILFS